MSHRELELQRLLDQSAIRDALARYARGVDRCDWDLLRSAFHADASDNHGAYRGDVNGLVDWVSRRHSGIEQATHFLGNCLIEFADDNTALVETYYAAFLRLGPRSGESRSMLLGKHAGGTHVDATVLGRYIDHFERRDGEWRIARRIGLYDAIRSEPVADPTRDPVHEWGTRDPSDPLHAMRRQVFGNR